MVMVKATVADVSTPPFAVPPLSCRKTLTVAVPVWFAIGVKVSTPDGETAGWTLKSVLLSLLTWNATVCDDSLGGPALMLLAHGALYAALSPALTLLPGVNDGASLTGLTVMVNVCGAEVSTPPFAVPPLSCSVTVMVAVPLASGAGVKVRTPLGETDGCDEKT